jgi:2-oxoisovalerate dehydrogenase E1 component alpha subunit
MLRSFKLFQPFSTYTPVFAMTDPSSLKIPTFRVINEEGEPVPGASISSEIFTKDFLHKIYKKMVEVQEFDTLYYDLQRQGVISFYMQNSGEEGLQVASASALKPEDWIFPQYRELGVFFWRGFSIQQASHQLFSNCKDLGEGKQMPVHYGSRDLNMQTVRSPLATQIPQSVGLGYGLRLKKESSISVSYFGEGASSEGDAHAAMNFASTLQSQTLFIVRNNQFAISTNVKDQFGSDGVAVRGVAYGMYAGRVDGNDVFASHLATSNARNFILEQKRPVLLEFMTYRRGHHSTSDDASRYRNKDEL